jgi:hypothetical protein
LCSCSGSGISTTLLKCASCVNDEDDDNPEVGDKCKVCIDSIFLDSDVTEATCMFVPGAACETLPPPRRSGMSPRF